MRLKIIISIALCGILFCSGLVLAKSNSKESEMSFSNFELLEWERLSDAASRYYTQTAKEIYSGENVDIKNKMRSLRDYYPKTKAYDPFAKRTLNKMIRYAYTVDISDDSSEVNEALSKYRSLIFKHLANLDVIEYALMLSRLDPRYGDEIFLKDIRDAIRNSWKGMKSPGMSPETAYKIITYGEETYLLQKHNVKVEKSEIYKVGKVFYNVHDVVSPTGDHYQLFFDVTTPILDINMRKAVRKKKKKIIIPLR